MRIAPGMTVLDIGCPLTQRMREMHPEDFPKTPGVVLRVFPWGLRLAEPGNLSNKWDCEYWEPMPNPDCYGCLGTGAIKGFGHDGERCDCIDAKEDL